MLHRCHQAERREERAGDGEAILQLLKEQLHSHDSAFGSNLRLATENATRFAEAFALSILRRKAEARGLWTSATKSIRLALVGGCSLSPLSDLVVHFLEVGGTHVESWSGYYDNYVAEIMDPTSDLYAFQPQVILILPSERSCQYSGTICDPSQEQQAQADKVVADLLALVNQANVFSGAQVVLANFRLPAYHDPGPLRYSMLASDYAFRKFVNLSLGQALPNFAYLCDVEFLANRRGTLATYDERTWFESKQPYAADFTLDVAREFAHIVDKLGATSKKVVVLDLDNTLWGGTVGDDGFEGIEIGTTSPRSEAYRDFQQFLLSLSTRGVLLAVCSKNDHDTAIEPFERHPEMVLRRKDITSFQANWDPKSENIRRVAAELNLGLDSFVFLDDNPAEIEIVRQFLPEVTAIHLGEDPAQFTRILKEARLFEVRNVTPEDLHRSKLYQNETQRKELLAGTTDMDSYLASLQMVAVISDFRMIDVPRITQLINKSNQFNLTTRRRTEAEVSKLVGNPGFASFTIRLSDRFGDYGLIAIVICKILGETLEIDTWLMSCRVLKRQVEEVTLNEIVFRARALGCTRVLGDYLPTPKNSMVKHLYATMGFTLFEENERHVRYELRTADFTTRRTKVELFKETK